jgi:hypothetical protein
MAAATQSTTRQNGGNQRVGHELAAVLPQVLGPMAGKTNHQQPRRSGDTGRGDHDEGRGDPHLDGDDPRPSVRHREADIDRRDQDQRERIDGPGASHQNPSGAPAWMTPKMTPHSTGAWSDRPASGLGMRAIELLQDSRASRTPTSVSLERAGEVVYARRCHLHARDVAQLGQRTCFGSSPKKVQCEAAFPQDRRDRSSPNQVVSHLARPDSGRVALAVQLSARSSALTDGSGAGLPLSGRTGPRPGGARQGRWHRRTAAAPRRPQRGTRTAGTRRPGRWRPAR